MFLIAKKTEIGLHQLRKYEEMKENMLCKRNWNQKTGILCVVLIVLFVVILASVIIFVKVQHFTGKTVMMNYYNILNV